jgi:hypothetical protein
MIFYHLSSHQFSYFLVFIWSVLCIFWVRSGSKSIAPKKKHIAPVNVPNSSGKDQMVEMWIKL